MLSLVVMPLCFIILCISLPFRGRSEAEALPLATLRGEGRKINTLFGKRVKISTMLPTRYSRLQNAQFLYLLGWLLNVFKLFTLLSSLVMAKMSCGQASSLINGYPIAPEDLAIRFSQKTSLSRFWYFRRC